MTSCNTGGKYLLVGERKEKGPVGRGWCSNRRRRCFGSKLGVQRLRCLGLDDVCELKFWALGSARPIGFVDNPPGTYLKREGIGAGA